MESEGWQECRTWHELFDSLCERAGHHDNAALASAYCALIGRGGSGDFEAAQKNLRNWRVGRHLPLRRNAMALAKLLGVEDDARLRRHWSALYAAARREAAAGVEAQPSVTAAAEEVSAEPASAGGATAAPRRRLVLHRSAIAAATLLAAGAGLYGVVRYRAYADLPIVNYEARVRMLVGESRLINANRGDCEGWQAPDWQRTAPRVPMSSLGSFSDGGVAWTPSVFCNGMAIARAVRFTATRVGEEEVELLGSYIKIMVTDAGHPLPDDAQPDEARSAEAEPDPQGARRR